MADRKRFANYDEFFAFYVREHRDRRNRMMHACGTTLGVALILIAAVTGHYWWALLGLPVAYGFAWTGHLVMEGNTPATFGHPFWSFISDFRMLWLMLTGQLRPWLEKTH